MTAPNFNTHLVISDLELAAETIRRLRKARAAGLITFLEAYFEGNPNADYGSGELVLILSPESLSNATNSRIIRDICDETGINSTIRGVGEDAGISDYFIEAIPELCLESESEPGVSSDTITRTKALIERVDESRTTRAIVLPKFWVVADDTQMVSLSVGMRGTFSDSDQSILGFRLAEALNRQLRFVIRGRTIEISPSDIPADIWPKVQAIPHLAPVLPQVAVNMAQALRDLADSIDPAKVGDDIPDDLTIYEQDGEDIPAGSLFYEVPGLEVMFQYRPDRED
jgi:hypothetical protein